MMTPKILILAIFFSISFITCHQIRENKINGQSSHLSYAGRTSNQGDSATALQWAGNSFRIRITGGALSLTLEDDFGKNFYNILINQDSIRPIRAKKGRHTYLLADLPPGDHEVEFFKRSDWSQGKSWVQGLSLSNGEFLIPEKKKGYIEIYGNSISTGHGNEDYSGKDRGDSIFANHYSSYVNQVARHFDAEHACICKSGIGISISWFPETIWDIYDRRNPEDAESSWDFKRKPADWVIVNLLQNDSWLIKRPNHEEYKAKFGDRKVNPEEVVQRYQDFILSLRSHYPKAVIIALLGNMDISSANSPWPALVEKALADLSDPDIHFMVMPYKNTPQHPKVEEHQAMADSLIRFIEDKGLTLDKK